MPHSPIFLALALSLPTAGAAAGFTTDELRNRTIEGGPSKRQLGHFGGELRPHSNCRLEVPDTYAQPGHDLLQAFGRAGVDQGKGGKYLILPREAFRSFIVLPCSTYAGLALLRSVIEGSGPDASSAPSITG